MAQFEEKELDITSINGGNKYNHGDALSPNSINSLVEGVLHNSAEIKKSSQSNGNLFSNALKGSKSGVSISASDISPIKHTVDVKISSKNLIPYPYYQSNSSNGGITYTDNGDGTITVNGTATGTSQILIVNQVYFPAGTYYLSGCPKNASGQALIYISNNGYTVYKSDYGDGVLVVLNEGGLYNVFIQVLSGAVLNNLVFKPQLELGTIATEYTPYVDDLSSVKLKKYGKNLIPYPYDYTQYSPIISNGVTYTDNGDGTITANGTATGTSFFVIQSKNTIPAGTYYFHCAPEELANQEGRCYVYFRDPDNQSIWGGDYGYGLQVKLNTATRIDIAIATYEGAVLNNLVFKPQLELGTVATEYEKYKEPTVYSPNSDGIVEGFTPYQPTTTLVSEKSDCIIDMSYNRDINKAFTELYNAIISLGGNV